MNREEKSKQARRKGGRKGGGVTHSNHKGIFASQGPSQEASQGPSQDTMEKITSSSSRSNIRKEEDSSLRSEPKKKVLATRLPEAWHPEDADVVWVGRELRLDSARVKYETEKFADYWRGAPGSKGCKQDWSATWRNWMRKASEEGLKPSPETGDFSWLT